MSDKRSLLEPSSSRRVRGKLDLVSQLPLEDNMDSQLSLEDFPELDDDSDPGFGFEAFRASWNNIKAGRYHWSPKEGEELADFQKCQTWEEKKDWIIAVAIIRNKFDRLRGDMKTKPEFEYFTEEERRMVVAVPGDDDNYGTDDAAIFEDMSDFRRMVADVPGDEENDDSDDASIYEDMSEDDLCG